MSAGVIRLMKEFCKSKNIKQKEVLEVALVEFFKRYGYQREIDKILEKA
jgi:histidyl-tRNA synthetase